MGFLDKAEDRAGEERRQGGHRDRQGRRLVDKKTQGKYAQHVDKVQEAAKKAVDDDNANANNAGQVPPAQKSGQAPPSQPPPGSPPQQDPPTAPPIS